MFVVDCQLGLCVAIILAISVNFSKSNYGIGENDGQVQPKLVLSNPSSTDFTIRVDTIDREAVGESLTNPMFDNSVLINNFSTKFPSILFECFVVRRFK